MDQSKPTKDNGLEAQLRGMILGNVRIGGDQATQAGQRSHTGRGRGRGGFSRDGSRDFQGRSSPSEVSPTTSHSVPAGYGRGSRAGYQHGRGRQAHQGHITRHNQQQRDSAALPGSTGAHTGHSAPWTARQQQQQQQQHHAHDQHQYNQNKSHSYSPKITQRPIDSVGSPASAHHAHSQAPRQHTTRFHGSPEGIMAQTEHLDMVASQEIPKVEMSLAEFEEKESFRRHLEAILRQYFAENYSGEIASIFLVGFGSLASGFGMPGSDMDLAVVPEWKDPAKITQIEIDREIPRLLEKAVLNAKMGGRLLTRTRVPILKVCQKPPEALYTALVEERKKWDELPEDEKYPTEVAAESNVEPKPEVGSNGENIVEQAKDADFEENFPAIGSVPKKDSKLKNSINKPELAGAKDYQPQQGEGQPELQPDANVDTGAEIKSSINKEQQPRVDKPWSREKALGPLDFPKTGCGIQCDLNFGNPLGIHNTHMLRCYSLTDPRVRPIVLFVKSWAKRRKINSAYSGTLSSYGWVLMVLHYLVNIAQPPVCPNLQLSVPQPKDVTQLESFFKDTVIAGYTVRFWRNEEEIVHAAQAGHLSQNHQSVGALLRGFFQYYASLSRFGPGHRQQQFFWTSEVLSLRTPGGIRSKQEKGWVSAKTTITAEKKVTNRYLFAIEDPFELDHNVARTVTHRGIVAIRDELRRAWNILVAIGRGQAPEGGLFDEVVEMTPSPPVVKDAPESANAKDDNPGTEGSVERKETSLEDSLADGKNTGQDEVLQGKEIHD